MCKVVGRAKDMPNTADGMLPNDRPDDSHDRQNSSDERVVALERFRRTQSSSWNSTDGGVAGPACKTHL